jgi:cytoskeletal protein CcmA (bactofilin family)
MFSRRKSDSDDKPKSDPVPPPPALPIHTPSLQKPIGFETVIGPGCELEGTLKSDGNIRIDGIFSGTLEILGNVLVGELAKVEAHINAKNISIAGTIRGDVTGKKVQLLRTARVWGDITAAALTTEEGAFIDGKISMPQHEPPEAEDPLPEDEPVIEENDDDAEETEVIDAVFADDEDTFQEEDDGDDEDASESGLKILDGDKDDDD